MAAFDVVIKREEGGGLQQVGIRMSEVQGVELRFGSLPEAAEEQEGHLGWQSVSDLSCISMVS